MAKTQTQTQNLVAFTPGGGVTMDMLAGWYVLYSIPEDTLALTKVRKAFRDNGLDETRLPKARRPEHVMQDACTKAQRISTNGHREEIRAQQVGRDENFLIYQMTRHVHDLKRRVIEHPKALRVLFSFEDGSLSFEPLDGATTEDVQGLADEIRSYYEKHQARLPGRGLRTIVRHYIEAAGAEFIRDGAYFFPKELHVPAWSKLHDHHGDLIRGFEFVQQLKMMLEDVYGTTPNFHDIPCINDEGQREFLKRKFIENCADDLKVYRDECLELVRSKQTPADEGGRQRAFRSDVRDRIVNRREEITMRIGQFKDILGETLGELDRDLGLADKALKKFLTEAES